MSKWQKRIEGETKKLLKKNNEDDRLFDFEIVESGKLFRIHFTIKNKDSLYYMDGQTITMEVKTIYGSGEDIFYYPEVKPLINFVSKIWHPNIGYKNGTICIDILNDPEKWTPFYTIESIFNSIILLLDEPNIDSPQEIEAAREYQDVVIKNKNIDEWKKIISTKFMR
jgi:ubiquitin-protein ligase